MLIHKKPQSRNLIRIGALGLLVFFINLKAPVPASGFDSISGPLQNQTQSFGVQFFGSLKNNTALDLFSEARAQWIRVPVSWSSIEPVNTTPENYDWSELDASVANARADGLDLILTLTEQPSWAADYPMGPVKNTGDILEFFGALVERYNGDGYNDAPGSPVVRYFEVYNEPDNSSIIFATEGGGYWGHNGNKYAELLRQLYPVLKAANPDARLVFGGLAMEWFEEDGGWFDRHFLDDVLANCQGHICFDVMNFHYYPDFRSNWESYGKDIIGKATYIRTKLKEYGFGGVPVICTETSLGSSKDYGSTAEAQSSYVVKVYVRSRAAGLPIVIWYKADDYGEDNLPGLLDVFLQPKLSYWSFKVMGSALNNALYQRSLTKEETGDEQIEGYVFQVGQRRVDVVWTEDTTTYNAVNAPQIPLTVSASAVRVKDKFGNETWISDVDDEVEDHQITIIVGGSPLYIEYYP